TALGGLSAQPVLSPPAIRAFAIYSRAYDPPELPGDSRPPTVTRSSDLSTSISRSLFGSFSVPPYKTGCKPTCVGISDFQLVTNVSPKL
ncbi:hypothetical protein M5D96_012334, partial [Drosophila gunungcola]